MNSRKEICFDKSIPYHIISRAVEGRKVFIEEDDLCRFVFQMYAANFGRSAPNIRRQDIKKAAIAILNGEEIPKNFIIVEHQPLVHRFSFSFVVNHRHEILIPNIDHGIPKYMQKVNNGFAKYYNLKHNRKSNLFERPYKIVPVKTNFQLDAVISYVNVKNSLDVYQSDWILKGPKNQKEALDFLNKYQFSSFPDLFGNRNSKLLASKIILEKFLGEEIIKNKKIYHKFIEDYLEKKLTDFNHLFLEE